MTGDASTDHPGLLLVGHGTRLAEGTEEFFELAELLARRIAPIPVIGCLLEFQHPTIPEGWRQLIERGANRVRVVPLLLFAAGHARRDIPELITQCQAECGGITSSQSGPLSRAPSIVGLLEERVRRCRQASDGVEEETALVLVGRGSRDPCATADMRVLGEIVAHRCGIRRRRVAFCAMAEPKLAETLDEVARCGSTRQVIVQPHLLFRGRLYDAVLREVQEAQRRHPGVRFRTGGYLGPNQEVVDAVLRRAFPELISDALKPPADTREISPRGL